MLSFVILCQQRENYCCQRSTSPSLSHMKQEGGPLTHITYNYRINQDLIIALLNIRWLLHQWAAENWTQLFFNEHNICRWVILCLPSQLPSSNISIQGLHNGDLNSLTAGTGTTLFPKDNTPNGLFGFIIISNFTQCHRRIKETLRMTAVKVDCRA